MENENLFEDVKKATAKRTRKPAPRDPALVVEFLSERIHMLWLLNSNRNAQYDMVHDATVHLLDELRRGLRKAAK